MTDIIEEVVSNWLFSRGYFVINNLKIGVNEIDLLAIKVKNGILNEKIHIEIQCSSNSIGYIGDSSSARIRSEKELEKGVVEYVEKIALRMGYPHEQVVLIKEVTLLHDIGKLGVQESVLNKKEKLTEEEWEMLRKHPVIGEDILKPVLLNADMLAMVRGHHERYDGKGYPDRLSCENINSFAKIISVADAYDAMTSLRAYRPDLSKEKAIEELKKNSSSQFDPRVVDIFVQILQEEA